MKLVPFDCVQPAGMTTMEGDVDLFADGSKHAMIQVEGLLCVPFSRATAKDDKELFATMTWDVAVPDASLVAHDGEPSLDQMTQARLLERMAVFYLRRLNTEIPSKHPARLEGSYPCFFRFASHILSLARKEKLPLWSSEWENDTLDQLTTAFQPYLHIIDVRLMNAIGENIIDIVTGGRSAIEVGMKDSMLSQFYEQSIGIREHTNYLARLLKQFVHRYPHANILEVGAGTGGITKAIFREIGQTLSSYTYTDISPGFFDAAKQVFDAYLGKLLFKVLDISKEPSQQGYVDHSYDVVVASMVLHATPVLEDTLRNVRRLLKPGGFLIVLELQVDNLARMGTIFGAFPGWWSGAQEGRVLSPCINVSEWDKLLRCTGFSGCDTVTPVRNSHIMPPVVFVSQAKDNRIEFLRDPMSSSIELFGDSQGTVAEDLVLLGGRSRKTSELVDQLESLLEEHWYHNIRIVRSLAELASLKISSSTTILSVTELDEPVFQKLSSVNWEALKRMLQEVRTVLWVSCGRRAENPYANMMVGLLRSAKRELPALDIQFFDFEGAQPLEASILAKTLLQLKATCLWQRRDGPSFLTTVEPELIRLETGQLIIPRVVVSQERNDRYNSLRRTLLTTKHENIGIEVSNEEVSRICLEKAPSPEGDPERCIRVDYSLLSAVRVTEEFGGMFIVLGQNCDSGAQVIALSTEHRMLVCPADELSVSVNVPSGYEAEFVSRVSQHLLSNIFLGGCCKGRTVVFHEPDDLSASVLEEEAKIRGLKPIFTQTATSLNPKFKSNVLAVHPMTTERVIRSMLPRDTVAFLDFSNKKTPNNTANLISTQLSLNCQRFSLDAMFSPTTTWVPPTSSMRSLSLRLEAAIAHALEHSNKASGNVLAVPLRTLSDLEDEQRLELRPQTVIDWTSHLDVSVRVRSADSQIKFSDCKTYWLAGLSGGLGLLLCEWMVHHGARYIAISSRRPNIEEAWLEKMRAAGAVVEIPTWLVIPFAYPIYLRGFYASQTSNETQLTIICSDITKRASVFETHKEICSTMPPIGGVCQGASKYSCFSISNPSGSQCNATDQLSSIQWF
jgi:hybrid polyketide synthase/nonribosomal peptide synthetase ACE1